MPPAPPVSFAGEELHEEVRWTRACVLSLREDESEEFL